MVENGQNKMQKWKHIAFDIRTLWLLVPVLGNMIFLPLLAAPFARLRRKDPLPLELRFFVIMAVLFFTYFTIRGLLALPDPGLEGAVSRIFPILFIAGLVWFHQFHLLEHFDYKWIAYTAFVLLGATSMEHFIFTSQGRVELLAGNSLLLAMALVPLVYLNLWVAWRGVARDRHIHLLAFVSILIVLGAFAGSRGPYLAATAAVGMHMLFVLFDRTAPWRQKLIYGTYVFVFYMFGSLSLLSGQFRERFLSFFKTVAAIEDPVSQMERSIGVRLQMWEASLQALQENPWFGYGPQNRFSAMIPYFDPAQNAPHFTHPHNFIFTFGNGGGSVGIVLGLGLIFSVLIGRFVSQGRSQTSVELLTQAVLVTCVTGMTNYVLFEGYAATVTCIMLIAPCYMVQRQAKRTAA